MNRIIVIATSAEIAAERKEPTMVCWSPRWSTAEPPALGATAVTSATNAASPSLLRASGFRNDLDARPPVGQDPVARHVRRQGFERHRLRVAAPSRKLVQLHRQEPRQRRLCASTTASGAVLSRRRSPAIARSG